MKFAFCLFKYFPYGGLQRSFLQLARTCLCRGHQIDVFTGSWTGEQPQDLNISIIPPKGLTNHRQYVDFARKMMKQTHGQNYDAVVGFNKMPGLDIYFASDVCYASQAQQRHLLYRASPRCRTLLALEDSVFNPQAKIPIISISEKVNEEYIAHYGTAPSLFHTVPPGIAVDKFQFSDPQSIRESWRQEFDIPHDHKAIVMVGSDFRRKGVARAMRALAALPDLQKNQTHLIIVGAGRQAPYRLLAKQLRIASQVTFAGERDDVPRCLIGADLLLHAAHHETAGAVLIEAMAAGLPVLVTASCGYAFHVAKAQAGMLIPSPFTQQDLNQKLLSMLASDNLRSWATNGLRYVQEHDVSSRQEKTAEFIETLSQAPTNRTKRV